MRDASQRRAAAVMVSALGLIAGLSPAASPVRAAAAPQRVPSELSASTRPPEAQERSRVAAWRAQRLAELTSDTGWLTLAGLFWLDPGTSSFGRGAGNTLVLDHPALPDTAGRFQREGTRVSFEAAPGVRITTDSGEPVSRVDLRSDAQGEPTELVCGPLRFHVIERAGNVGVRVRDVGSPLRSHFPGLDYFPVDSAWAVDARFEPYEPMRSIPIVNVLGMEEEMSSPGALVFEKDGRSYRLDAVLETPDAPELFVMFADRTSGQETYGAGRFLHVPHPTDGHVRVDFNEAYNPPCAFNNFATCPLPPPQNRLALRVTAGERKFKRPAGP